MIKRLKREKKDTKQCITFSLITSHITVRLCVLGLLTLDKPAWQSIVSGPVI